MVNHYQVDGRLVTIIEPKRTPAEERVHRLWSHYVMMLRYEADELPKNPPRYQSQRSAA